MKFFINHLYIFLTIAFAVTSQIIIKWKMSSINMVDDMPIFDKFIFVSSMLANPFIVLSIFLTLLSGLSWMIAMTKFEISYAYPYNAVGFMLILILSNILFGESISHNKVIGLIFIISGIIIGSRGA